MMPDASFYDRFGDLMNVLAHVVLENVTDEIDRVEFSIGMELQHGEVRPSSFKFATNPNAKSLAFIVGIDQVALAAAANEILDLFKEQAKAPIEVQVEYKRETDGWKQKLKFAYANDISSRTENSIVRKRSLFGTLFRRLIGE